MNGIAVANDATTGSSSQADRVRKLREKVEAQEAKLRKLRALRGQVDQQRITNSSLCKYLHFSAIDVIDTDCFSFCVCFSCRPVLDQSFV